MEVFFMLLAFSIRNYKSFRKETIFSMTAAPKQKGLDYSVFKKTICGKKHKVLSSAVIYGPNASGKTNLIGAMDTMKEIVLRGHIRNTNEDSLNQAAHTLELIPFRGSKNIPTLFGIKFIEQGLLIEYTIELQLGSFLDKKFERYIHSETLKINDDIVFERGKKLVVNIKNVKNEHLNDRIAQNIDSAKEIAFSGLNESELFLTNGFKTILSIGTISTSLLSCLIPATKLSLFLSGIENW
jgi:AAA15 family ATPase/GTPase